LSTSAAFAADPESCKTVRLSDVGWTDIQATTGVASVLLTALGYEPEVIQLSVPVTYASLKNKDLDVFLGNWMPSMTNDIKDYTADGSVETVSENLSGAGYGIVVPTYVADGGVKTLTDLGKFKDKFDGKIYGIEAGNDGNRIILDMIKDPATNLEGFELVESSEAGMLTQAEQSMKNNEWIAFLGWTPHPVMGAMEITYLDGMGDSGFGAATVHTNVRQGYMGECPNVGKFIANLKFNLDMEGEMMDAILKGEDADTVATDWLKKNPDAITPWIAGVTAFDGGDAATAIKTALGS
jgi:glycine betaine/proline transport system substrate-binding protein